MSVNQNEIKKFEAIAAEWWDPNGKFKPLHKFNPIRMGYVIKKICSIKNIDFSKNKPLDKIDILDVGCGGGLVAEPLNFKGAKVTAIDPSEKNIAVAKLHAKQSKAEINYQQTSIHDLPKSKKFSVITCLEVIEHVDDPDEFIREIAKHLKPGGILFVATLNRTLKSLLFAKFAAEYILRWLPKGTHEFDKFLKPHEITNFLEGQVKLVDAKGFSYNILSDSWQINNDLSQNYILCFTHA